MCKYQLHHHNNICGAAKGLKNLFEAQGAGFSKTAILIESVTTASLRSTRLLHTVNLVIYLLAGYLSAWAGLLNGYDEEVA